MSYNVHTSSMKSAIVAAVSDFDRIRRLAEQNPALSAITVISLVLLVVFKLPLLFKLAALAGVVAGAVAIGLNASRHDEAVICDNNEEA